MGFWSNARDAVSNAASNVRNAVSNTVSNAGDAISNAASNIGNAVSDFASGVGNYVSEWGGSIGSAISDFSSGAGSYVSGAGSGAINGVGSWVSDTITNPIDDMWSGLRQGSTQSDPLAENVQARGTFIAQAAREEDAKKMSPEINERYHVDKIPGISSNDTAWVFTDKETGERYIGIGGTDGVSSGTGLVDWVRNIFELGSGVGSQTSRAVAAYVQEEFDKTGEQIVVIGHSRGGSLAEEVARLAPDAVDYALNIQGPSVIDAIGVIPTVLGVSAAVDLVSGNDFADVYRITSDHSSETSPTSFGQAIVDYIGSPIMPPRNIAIEVGPHGVDPVANYFIAEGYNTFSPVILDLDGNGIQITELTQSSVFLDANNDGLENRIAWAAAGNGVLFYDANGDGGISETREFVFTEWDPTASSDLEAIASVFDTNGDGVLDANDAAFADFKVMVTNADGTHTVQTLSELGITSIDLRADATQIELPDGSVITGQTTFMWADGTVGTVGDVELSYDEQSNRVEQSSALDGSGNLVLTSTGYGIDGAVAFEQVSVVSPDGNLIENTYDDNGDGVVDRLQTISTAVVAGVSTETVTNSVGSNAASAVLANQTVTVRDGDTVTINRDSTGGGWFDQIEVQVTHSDDSRTITIEELSFDGTVLQSLVESISVDGLMRTNVIDLDVDGAADLTITHQIVVNTDGSRSETTTYYNADGSVRSAMTEDISADGQTRSMSTDADGDGAFEATQESEISVSVDGSTASVITYSNEDGSVSGTTSQSQSEDALTKLIAQDLDGDGLADVTIDEQTTINVDGSRGQAVTYFNGDGSVRSMVEERLAADQSSYEQWVDLNQSGTFEVTDLVQSVTVDATTNEQTTISWARNVDGSVSASSTSVVSDDGLNALVEVDADGDGDADTVSSDIIVLSTSGEATRTITTSNDDGSLRSEVQVVTSADGLTATATSDADGDGTADAVRVVTQAQESDGGRTTTSSNYAGDGITLVSNVTLSETADRRLITEAVDADGDGIDDRVSVTSASDDGTRTTTQTGYADDGSVTDQSVTVVSGDGLITTVTEDRNYDGINERQSTQTTALNSDGSQTTTSTSLNGDGSLRSETQTHVSDDGMVVTTFHDADGDGVFERTTVSTTRYEADGSTRQTSQVLASDETLLETSEVIISDDGLTTVGRVDADNDGVFDLVTTTTTTLHADGGQTTHVELRDNLGDLRSSEATTRSDDGRDVKVSYDFDGDGHIDRVIQTVENDQGEVTTETTNYNLDGDIETRSIRTTNDTGLITVETEHFDGDLALDQRSESVTTLNSDGSQTTLTEMLTRDGTVISSSQVDVSDDGFSSTTAADIDGDGDVEFTTSTVTAVDVSGTTTQSTERYAEDGSLMSSSVTVENADGNTRTATSDLDGNGVTDELTVSQVMASGDTVVTTNFYSTGGGAEATFTKTTSADGLNTSSELDLNSDGRVELRIIDRTDLGANGQVHREVQYLDEHYQSLGTELYFQSDDGLTSSISYDLDGDGVFDRITESHTVNEEDGDTIVTNKTLNSEGDVIASDVVIQSGDGLQTRTEVDIDGDGAFDRLDETAYGASGGSTRVIQEFGVGAALASSTTITVSADGFDTLAELDIDGDGYIDQDFRTVVAADQSQIGTYRDLSTLGHTQNEIVTTTSANGLSTTASFDVNGNGSIDFMRETLTTFDADGNQITTFSEKAEDGAVIYQEVHTASANGLSSVTTVDVDGDGDVEGTRTSTTTINTDGSQDVTTQTLYADGSLRANSEAHTSADGRSTTTSVDYDGNGIADKTSTQTISSDGEQVVVTKSFGEAGVLNSTFTTTTSADGLTIATIRDSATGTDTVETMTYAAAGGGSYTWDNGAAASTTSAHQTTEHSIDATGIDTWSFVEQYRDASNNLITNTFTAQLDQAAKNAVFEAAAKIYDSILDRDLDSVEREELVQFVEDGHLDVQGLASTLLSGGEYSSRYGTQSDAEFITQLYQNSFERAPSMMELASNLAALSGDTDPWSGLYDAKTRIELSVDLAQSSEHIVIGNGHLATNNFDVIMNPAVYERFLDRAYVEAMVENIVDVVYDRDATVQELAYFSNLLLEDIDKPDDVAQKLLALSGEVFGEETNSLHGLTGTDLVNQAFENAFGRAPNLEELGTWATMISDGSITIAQFVASLAQSAEHLATNNDHQIGDSALATTHGGNSAANTLTGGDDVDVFVGGEGDDILLGDNGSDAYVWSKGDGNDLIDDNGDALSEIDRLVLTDVSSDDVELHRPNTNSVIGDGNDESNDLLITIISTGEVIDVREHFANSSLGDGIEAITFSDGVTWTLEDIEANTWVNGTDAAERLNGVSNFGENFAGGVGNDTLDGNNGDDTLVGGEGDDILWGDNGSDTYVWSKGDGNDRIDDNGTSLSEIDRLELTDVASGDVTLTRVTGSDDLLITIVSTDDVLDVREQFNNTAYGYGLEAIAFSDGVIWEYKDILANTWVIGTDDLSDVNTLGGFSEFDENFDAGAANDSITANGGDDTLVGGAGDDKLYGDNGSDTYVWSTGDGNDRIDDNGDALSEIDRLVLTDVSSDDVELHRPNTNSVIGDGNDESNDLLITIVSTGEVLDVREQFINTADGYGLEAISFSDGVTWTLEDIQTNTWVKGTDGNDTLNGLSNFDENYAGGAGNDTINANNGDDLIIGGGGADILKGGNGSDTYQWSLGDGNDTIYDTGTSLSETDVLELAGIGSTDIDLTQSGNNLIVSILPSDESITVTNRFYSASTGYGVELLAFADGVMVEVLSDAVAQTIVTGTAANNTLSGWGFTDHFYAGDGNDVINANNGDDTLVGGAGIDTLRGGNGSDAYIWSKGDGNDRIDDNGTSLIEIDRLILTDVSSDDVELHRPNTNSVIGDGNDESNDLLITIVSTGEVLDVREQFYSTNVGDGIEAITFSDGVTWTIEDIEANTWVNGSSGNDTLTGKSSFDENFSGGAGNDKLDGNGGDDTLIGGAGVDTLLGDDGSDTYVWSKGDGNDVLDDNGDSRSEIDRLELTDVSSDDVELHRPNTNSVIGDGNDESNDLLITIISTGEVIDVREHFANSSLGDGIEAITFSDGVTWTLEDIEANTWVNGSSGNDTLTGKSSFDENFSGGAGNDKLDGNGGDDTLIGGAGVDTLLGDDGSDTYVWSKGDGNDVLDDNGDSRSEIDRLELTDVSSDDVVLRRLNWEVADGDGNSELNDLQITILSTGEVIEVLEQFDNSSLGDGIEAISFSDGVIWTLEDIKANTWVNGSAGNDTLTGKSSFDENFSGGAGNDTINANSGDDTLNGGDDDDTLDGGAGADIILGGVGNDVLTGGAGADTFIFESGAGQDIVTDFEVDVTGEQIDLSGFSSESSFVGLLSNFVNQVGADTVIDDGNGNSVTLTDVAMTTLTEGDFIL